MGVAEKLLPREGEEVMDHDEIPPLPSEIEDAITRHHEHENDSVHRPLWLIWRQPAKSADYGFEFPALYAVADTEDRARYMYRLAMGSWWGNQDERKPKIWVERIPANHNFGSSLDDAIYADPYVQKALRYFRDKGGA